MGNKEVFQIWQILILALLEIIRFKVHSMYNPFHRNYGSTNV